MHKKHIVKEVKPGSIAEEMEIEPGDEIVRIGDNDIEDIFDYDYLCMDSYLEVLVRKKNGEEEILEIDKDEDEDLGIVFDSGLMDECRSCRNRCVFCFIDQNPRGMRKTIYFKDDDTRLSFLQGNYVTMTNWSEEEIDRIIRYRMEPINISVQTMNPELRVKMLRNKTAGDVLKFLDRLYEAGITMNGQIVLCKGLNDGDELRFSLQKLMGYMPVMQSVSVVPVGLSKYREKLYPLVPFEKEDAREVIDIIESFQKKAMEKYGTHFVQASDEWYIKAGIDVPEEERYDGYLQLENGVGMIRLLMEEVREVVREEKKKRAKKSGTPKKRTVTIATAYSVYETIVMLAGEIMEAFPEVKVNVERIRNDFFGEQITVSGLITGQDLTAQLKGKDLGDALLITHYMLRSGEEVFLDDMTVTQVRETLQCPVVIVKSSGKDLLDAVLKG
ncbi:MAG: DUF512 domain-containing protein [Lachnospiraceae bacterium]|nr:DUF512 domain-containing protein [Lachnospiraceae bacterium]